jgi:predicted metal-dependent phosphoesterase TrpH
MPGQIDLHIHTTFSDGLAEPQEVLEIVRKRKLLAFSICDHDNILGYFAAKKLMTSSDPELIPGVELSAGRDIEDIHILGYYFDPDSAPLNRALEEFRERRNSRARKMLLKLEEMNISIPYELARKIAGSSGIGRPHIADAMVRVGAIKNYETAFAKYIGNNCPAYVPKENMTPGEAIDLIHKAHGLAFLAHPGIGTAGEHIEEFAEQGLDGVEIYHPNHSARQIDKYAETARRLRLLISGGSDFHNREGRFGMIGAQPVPYELLASMKEKITSIHRG